MSILLNLMDLLMISSMTASNLPKFHRNLSTFSRNLSVFSTKFTASVLANDPSVRVVPENHIMTGACGVFLFSRNERRHRGVDTAEAELPEHRAGERDQRVDPRDNLRELHAAAQQDNVPEAGVVDEDLAPGGLARRLLLQNSSF